MSLVIYVAEEETRYSPQIVKKLGDKGLVIPLDFGDYLIGARGVKADGGDGWCGVEHKRATDLAGGILISNRHIEQLTRMGEIYDEVVMLISERIEPNGDGLACTYRMRGGEWELSPMRPANSEKTLTYSRYRKHLFTIERRLGVRVVEVDGWERAARYILMLADWWSTPLALHESAMGMVKTISLNSGRGAKPSLVRRVASELGGLGVVRSQSVEDKARELGLSLGDVVNWGEGDWMEVKGIDSLAKKVVEEIWTPLGPSGSTKRG